MKRLPALLAATALAVTGIAAAAPAAHAAASCDQDTTKPTLTGMTPTVITLGTSPKVVTFKPIVTHACGIEDWTILGDDASFFVMKGAASEALEPYSNGDAGLNHATVRVVDPSYNQAVKVVAYRLLRNATFRSGSFNASPEPVKKSGKLTVKGTLARADWESGSYKNYGKQTIAIQFKAKGKSTYTTITHVKTSSSGTFSTKLSAARGDGTWRATYAGNSVTGHATSATDYVDVH